MAVVNLTEVAVYFAKALLYHNQKPNPFKVLIRLMLLITISH